MVLSLVKFSTRVAKQVNAVWKDTRSDIELNIQVQFLSLV